jgi:hypothetical protein
MKKSYRPGPVGAMMDEYERAADELKTVMRNISQPDYVTILDKETRDPDCVSVQTIMNHAVRAGFGYANYIGVQFGDSYTERQENYNVQTPESACARLDDMLSYTLETMQNKWSITDEEVRNNIIRTRWQQNYDLNNWWSMPLYTYSATEGRLKGFWQLIRNSC